MFFWMINKLRRNFNNLLRFSIVGGLGTAINLSFYYMSYELVHLGINASSILAFMAAVIHNYVLNHLWTFEIENKNRPVSIKLFFYYLIGNMQGLLINLMVLNAFVAFAGIRFHLIGQLLGIFFGMMSNYIYAKKIVFRKRSF